MNPQSTQVERTQTRDETIQNLSARTARLEMLLEQSQEQTFLVCTQMDSMMTRYPDGFPRKSFGTTITSTNHNESMCPTVMNTPLWDIGEEELSLDSDFDSDCESVVDVKDNDDNHNDVPNISLQEKQMDGQHKVDGEDLLSEISNVSSSSSISSVSSTDTGHFSLYSFVFLFAFCRLFFFVFLLWCYSNKYQMDEGDFEIYNPKQYAI